MTAGTPKERYVRWGVVGVKGLSVVPLFQVEIAALFALITYSACLINGFTYDDYLVLVKNQWIGREGFLPAIFSQRYFDISGEATYRPVVTFFTGYVQLFPGQIRSLFIFSA